MLRAFLGLVVALVLAAGAPASARADTAEALPVAVGGVWDLGSDRGVTWFQFGRQRVFQIPGASREAKAALKASQKSHISVFAAYDPDSGRVDADGRLTFVVRRLTYDGRTIEAAAATPLPETTEERELLGRAVARSSALRDQGRLEEAHATIRAVLASGPMEPRLYEAALRSQVATASELAHDLGLERRAEADVLRMEAYRALEGVRILAPGDRGVASAMAHMLSELGAYEEALAVFRELAQSDPESAYWPTLNGSIVQRLLARPEEALGSLDAFAAANGPQTGMAFHYHRGWTLAALGRHEAAIEAFTLGLADQPDFPWALAKRACSEAALGRLRAALADHERAVRLIEEVVPTSSARNAAEFNLDRARAVRDELRAGVAKDETATLPGLCAGYWPTNEEPRPRSPLLPSDLVSHRAPAP